MTSYLVRVIDRSTHSIHMVRAFVSLNSDTANKHVTVPVSVMCSFEPAVCDESQLQKCKKNSLTHQPSQRPAGRRGDQHQAKRAHTTYNPN